jgi:pyruvate/2-oxoglutarate dehydrogenase complex dihydrolipoamide dehydrogenase (E3) component/uncharacterized membrane protein YdjX (TVP38/TMEM64 family)
MKKWLILPVLALLAAAFYGSGLNHWLTLEGMQSGIEQILAARDAMPIRSAVIFLIVYVAVTALSLPGAVVMTLAGGALFGLWWGTLLVSFASSIGALLAFLVSRYLLRDTVQSRFGDRLGTINAGIKRDGAFYLFTLRLIPVFPFFLINLLMGLTTMPALTFYAVSQLGMLAGTVVYVNAGTQLAQLTSLSGIVSPGILLSFALLATFPWLARTGVNLWRKQRLYSRWQRPARFERNLIVIGAGAAGLVSAYIAAAVKAKVTLIEAHKMGGDCLNYGCVPSKTLIKSARVAHQIRQADRYGLHAGQPRFSFRQVMARIQQVIREIEPHDSIERYTGLGVEVLQGHARIIDPWTVEITLAGGSVQRLTTRSIIIAAGATPFVPPLPGLEQTGYLTSDTLWEALATHETPPERMVVLGGGPIGCELAQAFARLGSQVTQIEMGPRLLIREDAEVSHRVQQSLEADGVTVLTGHKALRCEREGEYKYIVVEQGGQSWRIPFNELICAVGRVPRLAGYGLEQLGIPTERTVITNEYLETLYPNIYAAGDVAGPYQFTHTAAHQAWYAVVNALFGDVKRFRVDYSVIPWTTFVDPEVARVGLNEQEAAERGIAYELSRYEINDLDRAIAEGVAYGFIKVLTVPGKDRILGVTIVGEHAGELLAEFVLAMRWGLGLNKILSTIHTYPTLSESNKYVAGVWKRAHAPQTVLKWLERYHHWRRH